MRSNFYIIMNMAVAAFGLMILIMSIVGFPIQWEVITAISTYVFLHSLNNALAEVERRQTIKRYVDYMIKLSRKDSDG